MKVNTPKPIYMRSDYIDDRVRSLSSRVWPLDIGFTSRVFPKSNKASKELISLLRKEGIAFE